MCRHWRHRRLPWLSVPPATNMFVIFMSQIVLYFLHSTPILSFYIDVVLTLFICNVATHCDNLLCRPRTANLVLWKLSVFTDPAQLIRHHINGLVQERRNPSALAVELRLSCTNPSICSVFQVGSLLQEILASRLATVEYDPVVCPAISKSLTDDIREKVKRLNYDRCKIVCLVTLGEKQHQGVRMSSRCVWDADRDTSATANWENATLFCTATVYGIYHEWLDLCDCSRKDT